MARPARILVRGRRPEQIRSQGTCAESHPIKQTRPVSGEPKLTITDSNRETNDPWRRGPLRSRQQRRIDVGFPHNATRSGSVSGEAASAQIGAELHLGPAPAN